jgi:hypothetical protein
LKFIVPDLLVAVVLTFSSTVSVVAQVPGVRPFQSAIEFSELGRWEVPEGFEPSGVGYAHVGMTVWSSESDRAFVLTRGLRVVKEISLPISERLIGVANPSGGAVEVLASRPLRLLRLNLGTGAVRVDTLSNSAVAVHADHGGDGWVVAIADSAGAPVRLARVTVAPGGRVTLTHGIGTSFVTPVVVGLGDAVFASEVRRPHTISYLEGADFIWSSAPPAGLLDSLSIAARGSAPPDQWNAVRVLPLDSGFIQTLADPTSFWRVLVLYDEAGEPRRTPIMRGPFAFVRSFPAESEIIAIQRLNRPEVVSYQWRWRRQR